MQNPLLVYSYRYYLFVITIISNAIICSAAAWNLPISQNANLHTQSHIDSYMIFLGALSLLVLLSMLFADVFSRRAFTGRVWVECLWIDFLWLLHFLGSIIVTTNLPRDMCLPQVERVYVNSCASVKLLMAFSWICTINLFIYLVFLVGSAIVHQRRDGAVWSAQVRSYPWYHLYCHELGSSPKLLRHHDPAPITAPQPQHPIGLLRVSVLSSLFRAERRSYQPDGDIEHIAPQPTMQQARPVSTLPTTLYPLHVLAVLETTPETEPEPEAGGGLSFSPRFSQPQQHRRSSLIVDGGPQPLLNWPRADIMSNPPPKRGVARKKVPASTLPFITELPRETGEGEGLPSSVPSNLRRLSPELDRPGPRHV